MNTPNPIAPNATILVVDDDPHIREVVRFALEKAGFRAIEARDGRQALACYASDAPDLVVLDILMPEMDGTDVCRRLRRESQVPIVFLSSKDDEIDRVVGLELGGDDYVTKPFSPRELVARVRAVLRRTVASTEPDGSSAEPRTALRVIQHGLLRIDLDRFQAYWADSKVVLTVTELGLLRTLLGYPEKVFSRTELIDGAYEYDNVISDRTVDSHIRRIRRKFRAVGANLIETVHGLGYKLGRCR